MLENKQGSDLIGPGNENELHSKCLGRKEALESVL